jgi:putative ABC transport system permease protein
MLAIKLAFRNLIGAGLRTWLNVIVLSFSFVVIIWYRGFLEGWNREARLDTINWEIGGGQYWQNAYDPYDPFTLTDGHAVLPETLKKEINDGKATPILITQATIYPEGRMQSALLKGINPDQHILELPTRMLKNDTTQLTAIIGTRMAKSNKLEKGSILTVRWRNVNGTFDATELKIAGVFKTNVPAVDVGQLWVPLNRLRQMMQMPREASLVVVSPNTSTLNVAGWKFKDQEFLLSDIDKIIKSKSAGAAILYTLLLLLAMLAIFDTQILSIFRRQREIGTLIALGMTRSRVVELFTVEGAMHSILAALVAAVYGIPLLTIMAVHGFTLPAGTDSYGLTMSDTIFPVYGIGLVAGTVIVIFITATIVSFIPARRIAKMKPTDAIRGKIQ